MIRICYIIGQLEKGGAERQLYQLLRGIDKDIFQPFFICLSKGGYWKKDIQGLGIECFELDKRKFRKLHKLLQLVKLINTIKPHIVHTFLSYANSYGRIAAVLSRTQTIIASERNSGQIGADKTRTQLFLDRLLALFSTKIICNSYSCRDSLVKRYRFDNNKIVTIHNGINPTEFSNSKVCNNRNGSTAKVIGTLGNVTAQKNHRLFLDMGKIVLDRHPNANIKLMIVGEGPLRNDLIRYSRYLGIGDNIIFTGERHDIPNILFGMDIFVITSLYEGLPNAIMEAMAASLPVVATDVGGNRELVTNNVTGFLCPSGDYLSLAERVIQLLMNKKRAQEMGRNGRQNILNEFGLEKMIRSTENLYMELMRRKTWFHLGLRS